MISLNDFYRERSRIDKFNIYVTFGNGYANNDKYVLSLLHKYQMPATFFVIPIKEADLDIKREMMKQFYPLSPYSDTKPCYRNYWLQTKEQISKLFYSIFAGNSSPYRVNATITGGYER